MAKITITLSEAAVNALAKNYKTTNDRAIKSAAEDISFKLQQLTSGWNVHNRVSSFGESAEIEAR